MTHATSAFGLSSTQWTAIAAAAQACAAVGAIALLIVTVLSKRHATEAIDASTRLATHTEDLVRATRETQDLAVRPVIELRRDLPTGRLWITNAGNGPLLEPYLGGTENRLALLAEEDGAFVEVGALRPGDHAFAVVGSADPLDPIALRGRTLVGSELDWHIQRDLGAHTVVATLADSKQTWSDSV